MIRFFLLALLVSAATRCAPRSVVYTPPDWPVPLEAEIYKPRHKPGVASPPAPAPAVILVYGSGWFTTDQRWQMRGIAGRLADRGYFVMNVTYRMTPEWGYPAPVDDLGAALDWLEDHAAGNGVDRTRIGLFGYSAGGHLVLLRGLTDRRVKGIVAGAAPADLMWFEGGTLVQYFIGGTREQYPDVYGEASPLYLVNRRSPPVFLYHGGEDGLIPPIHARVMKEALDDWHVPNELYILGGKNHVTAFIFGGPAERKGMDFLDRFLQPGGR